MTKADKIASRIVLYTVLAFALLLGYYASHVNDTSDRWMKCTGLANKVQMYGGGLTYEEVQYKRQHCDLYSR